MSFNIFVPHTPKPALLAARTGPSAQTQMLFSFFPSSATAAHPLPGSSPLRVGKPSARIEAPALSAAAAYDSFYGSSLTQKPRHKFKLVDKPIVFHSRISSSGYGQRHEMSHSKAKKNMNIAAPHLPVILPRYPMEDNHEDGPPTAACWSPPEWYIPGPSPAVSVTASPLLDMTYSRKGDLLALASMDGTVQVFSLAKSRHRRPPFVFSSSNAPVRSVALSHSQELVLTSSDDGVASLFYMGETCNGGNASMSRRASPVIRIDPSSSSSPASKKQGGSCRSNSIGGSSPFTSISTVSNTAPSFPTVTSAFFFYLDRYLLVASQNKLSLHTYHIAIPAKDALIRHYHHRSISSSFSSSTTSAANSTAESSHTVHVWVHDHAHQLTAVACLNSTLSPLILTACSDRSFSLLDATHGSFLRTFSDAHARPIHSLSVPNSSQFVASPSLAPSHLDVFASAATDNTVSLWDLRAGAAKIASFMDHVNRREKIGVAFSPCVRFLAVGSEDGAAYVYDLRKGREMVYTTSSSSSSSSGMAYKGEEEDDVEDGRERRCRARKGGRAGPPPHGDVVSCVAFNPLRPELVTGSYDGGVRFHDRGE